jgi:hypothetical protein
MVYLQGKDEINLEIFDRDKFLYIPGSGCSYYLKQSILGSNSSWEEKFDSNQKYFTGKGQKGNH